MWWRRGDSSSLFLTVGFIGEKGGETDEPAIFLHKGSRKGEAGRPHQKWIQWKDECGEIKRLFDVLQVRPVGGPSIPPPSRDQKVKRSGWETTSSWSACRLRDTWWGSFGSALLLVEPPSHWSCPPQHLSYASGDLMVDASFMQTLWSINPISSGCELAEGDNFYGSNSMTFISRNRSGEGRDLTGV